MIGDSEFEGIQENRRSTWAAGSEVERERPRVGDGSTMAA